MNFKVYPNIRTKQPIKFDAYVDANVTLSRYVTESLGGLPNESMLEEQWNELPAAVEGKPLRCITTIHGFQAATPQRFYLNRLTDVVGVSGTGRVLNGVVLPSGKVAIEWQYPYATIGIYDDFDQFYSIHVESQRDSSEVVFID